MSVLNLPELPQVDALAAALALEGFPSPRRVAVRALTTLLASDWTLERTAAGIEADTRAEIAALEAEEAA